MAKFCGNCGAEMADDARICGSCGTLMEEVDVAPAPATKKKLTPVVAVAVVAAVAVLIACLLPAFGVVGYKKALKDYYNFTCKGKISEKSLIALAPKDVWDAMEDSWDEDDMDFDMDEFAENYEEVFDDMKDYLDEEYGDNWRITYKVDSKKKIKDSKLKKIARALNDDYDIKKSSVKKGFDLKIEWEIKGSEDDEDGKIKDVAALKIDGKWYFVRYWINGDDCRVIFAPSLYSLMD